MSAAAAQNSESNKQAAVSATIRRSDGDPEGHSESPRQGQAVAGTAALCSGRPGLLLLLVVPFRLTGSRLPFVYSVPSKPFMACFLWL